MNPAHPIRGLGKFSSSGRADQSQTLRASIGGPRELIRELNRRIDARTLSTADAGKAIDFIRDLDRVLAIAPAAQFSLDPESQKLLDERAAARVSKEWAASDRLRDVLAARGILIEDTRDGQRWRRAE